MKRKTKETDVGSTAWYSCGKPIVMSTFHPCPVITALVTIRPFYKM